MTFLGKLLPVPGPVPLTPSVKNEPPPAVQLTFTQKAQDNFWAQVPGGSLLVTFGLQSRAETLASQCRVPGLLVAGDVDASLRPTTA